MCAPPAQTDEARRAAAFGRMEPMFPHNRGLREIFNFMVAAHPRAIDYIEQAPVIVLAATAGNAPQSSERAFVQEQLGILCARGAKLREVMRAYGLPLPLRAIDARVLTSTRATVIRRLALMNPSTLAQIIPQKRQQQNAWLEALPHWCDAMARREAQPCLFFEWAAVHLAGMAYRQAEEVDHLVDFVRAHAGSFNPLWTLERVRTREREWHEELRRVRTTSAPRPDLPPDDPIDYAPLPLLSQQGDFTFVALQTREALHEDGAVMSHCVVSYWLYVASGRSRIYSIRQDDVRVAMMELINPGAYGRFGPASRYYMQQTVGVRNSRPPPGVLKAVAAFVDDINARAAAGAARPKGTDVVRDEPTGAADGAGAQLPSSINAPAAVSTGATSTGASAARFIVSSVRRLVSGYGSIIGPGGSAPDTGDRNQSADPGAPGHGGART